MITNKPEVVAYHHSNKTNPDIRGVTLFHDPSCASEHEVTEPLIRLSDYEALQAECEKLRKAAEKFSRVERCMEALESDEIEGSVWTACTLLLIGSAHKLNTTSSVVTQEGVTVEDQDVGDWRVTVERISKGGTDRG